MSEKYTPGPWVADGLRIRDADTDYLVATIQDGGHVVIENLITPERQHQHARLIAAAPETASERNRLKSEKAELVRWLEACLDMVRGKGPPDWDGIRAAIAKAKGNQP